jgi:hypothetical protein
MSGPGATRGFTFQFAWAVASSLAVLEGEGETLVVEGAEDVVDVQILGRDDRRLRVSQAKTRQEPYTWNPAALVDVIAAWMHLAEDGEARSEFVTDGSLGPSVVANLVPALRRASEGQLTEDDRAWLRERDLDPDASILGRVTVRSRQPSADELLNGAALQVLRFRDLLGGATVAEAEAVVNELYRVASLRSGEADVAARRLTRRDIADIVGVPVDVIDAAPCLDRRQAFAPPRWSLVSHRTPSERRLIAVADDRLGRAARAKSRPLLFDESSAQRGPGWGAAHCRYGRRAVVLAC